MTPSTHAATKSPSWMQKAALKATGWQSRKQTLGGSSPPRRRLYSTYQARSISICDTNTKWAKRTSRDSFDAQRTKCQTSFVYLICVSRFHIRKNRSRESSQISGPPNPCATQNCGIKLLIQPDQNRPNSSRCFCGMLTSFSPMFRTHTYTRPELIRAVRLRAIAHLSPAPIWHGGSVLLNSLRFNPLKWPLGRAGFVAAPAMIFREAS